MFVQLFQTYCVNCRSLLVCFILFFYFIKWFIDIFHKINCIKLLDKNISNLVICFSYPNVFSKIVVRAAIKIKISKIK